MRVGRNGFKGVVACPACGKEFVFAYSDAKGHASVPCVRCSRIIMVIMRAGKRLLSTEKEKNLGMMQIDMRRA